MDFAFSEEQQMLREQARQFLASKTPESKVVELANSDEGWDRSLHGEMAELGWIGLSASENAGGAGMSFLDEAVLLEELGYALYPGPYFSTVALALPALETQPELLAKVAAGELTATVAAPLARVPDGAIADLIVVAEGEGGSATLSLHESGSCTIEPLSTMDRTRRYAKVTPNGEGTVLAEGKDGDALMRQIELRALAAAALEAVGVAQKALDLAREYVKERQQFGKPIGIYQAVSHQVADTYLQVELARSLAYWAAWCVAESDEQAGRAALAAKAQATEAAVFACERSIQVHGGIGFTWEHILHRYYKRAQWLQGFRGYPSTQLSRIADALLV
jgi:alkylation response protein AidB-like acyl-CoA dehydrogenase